MSEQLRTRTEHSRSLADAEKYKALGVLKDVGLLIPVSELETYHGRMAPEDEATTWNVDPSFTNGKHDGGNYNVNHRATLYTSDRQTAEDFADARVGYPTMYFGYLNRQVKNYTPEQNIGRLERQNAHLAKLWEERRREEPSYTQPEPDTWTMEQLLASGSVVEARYLEATRGREDYNTFKERITGQGRAEVHSIVSDDEDAMVIDLSFDSRKLDEATRQSYQQALRTLAMPLTVGSPVDFSARDAVGNYVDALRTKSRGYIASEDVTEIAQKAGTDMRTTEQLSGAFNARQITAVEPSYLAGQLLQSKKDIVEVTIPLQGEEGKMPLNMEYVLRYFRENHIVGIKQSLDSATINRSIDAVSFVDLEKTWTENGLAAERADTQSKLGSLASRFTPEVGPKAGERHSLLTKLDNPYAKPEELVAAAMEVPGYKRIFEADAGNWEGYSLAQHTETVLRNFDENFADSVPVSMLAPMRLAILAHDLGKPEAAAKGQKHRQQEYNAAQAKDFFKKLGVGRNAQQLLQAVIGDGEQLAFEMDVRGVGLPAETALRGLGAIVLGSNKPEQTTGFVEMCRMLQICDGGAYTSMAVTSGPRGQGRYRNAPAFNNTFENPTGPGKRGLKLRQLGNTPPAKNLTPSKE